MKKILLLLAVMPLMLFSCSNELTLEERIAEEEKLLTDKERLLLHQVPEFDYNSFYEKEQQVFATYTEEEVDGWRITKDGQGLVTQVLFDDITQQQPPSDGKSFLTHFFGEEAAAHFKKTGSNEHGEQYVQYCGDFDVSHYVFLYDEQGVMRKASGAYYPTEGLSVEPTIRFYAAQMIFASSLGRSVQSIKDQPYLLIMLIPSGTRFVPTLVYHLYEKKVEGVSISEHFAWVNAHTGRLILEGDVY